MAAPFMQIRFPAIQEKILRRHLLEKRKAVFNEMVMPDLESKGISHSADFILQFHGRLMNLDDYKKFDKWVEKLGYRWKYIKEGSGSVGVTGYLYKPDSENDFEKPRGWDSGCEGCDGTGKTETGRSCFVCNSSEFFAEGGFDRKKTVNEITKMTLEMKKESEVQ